MKLQQISADCNSCMLLRIVLRTWPFHSVRFLQAVRLGEGFVTGQEVWIWSPSSWICWRFWLIHQLGKSTEIILIVSWWSIKSANFSDDCLILIRCFFNMLDARDRWNIWVCPTIGYPMMPHRIQFLIIIFPVSNCHLYPVVRLIWFNMMPVL
jgi:hypothetical protein